MVLRNRSRGVPGIWFSGDAQGIAKGTSRSRSRAEEALELPVTPGDRRGASPPSAAPGRSGVKGASGEARVWGPGAREGPGPGKRGQQHTRCVAGKQRSGRLSGVPWRGSQDPAQTSRFWGGHSRPGMQRTRCEVPS